MTSLTKLVALLLLLSLCAGSYWLGTKKREVIESVEIVVKIDTVYIDTPAPPVDVKPSEPKVVYLTEYKTERDTIINTVKDSVLVYLPNSDYTFEQDSLYKIEARGYDVSLTSVELYNRHTATTKTLITPAKAWSVSAFARASLMGAAATQSVGAVAEYHTKICDIGIEYEYLTTGKSGVNLTLRRRLFGGNRRH